MPRPYTHAACQKSFAMFSLYVYMFFHSCKKYRIGLDYNILLALIFDVVWIVFRVKTCMAVFWTFKISTPDSQGHVQVKNTLGFGFKTLFLFFFFWSVCADFSPVCLCDHHIVFSLPMNLNNSFGICCNGYLNWSIGRMNWLEPLQLHQFTVERIFCWWLHRHSKGVCEVSWRKQPCTWSDGVHDKAT